MCLSGPVVLQFIAACEDFRHRVATQRPINALIAEVKSAQIQVSGAMTYQQQLFALREWTRRRP